MFYASVYALNDTDILASYSTDARDFPQANISDYQSGIFSSEYFKFTISIRVDSEIIGYLYQYLIFTQLNEFQMKMFAIFSTTLLIASFLAHLFPWYYCHNLWINEGD